MKWTRTPPTEPGWYWALYPSAQRPVIVQIHPNSWIPSDRHGTRWAGPIPLPEEDKP